MTHEKKKMRNTGADLVFQGLVIFLCVVVFLVIAYPLYFVIIASFSSSDLVNTGKVVLFPKGITFYGYSKIFSDSVIWKGYLNTILYTLGYTAFSMFITTPAAYALSRKEFAGRKIINLFFVFTMFFGGGMIPGYLLMKGLHLINTPWAMILPACVNVYNLIIMRTFFEQLPEDLYEASILDGCSHFTYLLKVVLPLSKAVLSVVMLYYMVARWNGFMDALLYLQDEELMPLQIILRRYLIISESVPGVAYAQRNADQIKYGCIIVSTVPMLIIYPMIQKYFEKGVMLGAIKG